MTRLFWIQTLLMTAYAIAFCLFLAAAGITVLLIVGAFVDGLWWLLALTPVEMFVVVLLFRLAVFFPSLSYDLEHHVR